MKMSNTERTLVFLMLVFIAMTVTLVYIKVYQKTPEISSTQGTTGQAGETGDQGEKGATGAKGETGKTGPQGAPGKNFWGQ